MFLVRLPRLNGISNLGSRDMYTVVGKRCVSKYAFVVNVLTVS